MSIRQFFTYLFLIISTLNAISQNEDYFGTPYFLLENKIYDEDINTVQLNIEGNLLSAPIIVLNSNQQLRLSFDDLNPDHRTFYYTLIHCTSDWKETGLFSTEYIQGVPDDIIFDNVYSRNQGQDFIHHWLTFPTENMKIIRSGNYLIKVYEEGNPDNVIITWRFMVTENRIEVDGRVFPTLDAQYRSYKQELNFTLRSETYQFTNPYDDLSVTILQNNRWDNAHFDIQPTFYKGYEIEYVNNIKLVFNGGNEYRFFDIRNLSSPSGAIDKITTDSLGYRHAYLKPDQKRAYKVYSSFIDLNGRRYIKNDLWGDDSNASADYCWMHFTLPYPQRIPNGDVYVFGELSNWLCSKQNKMIFNEEKQVYEGDIYLKQGYYDYEYVFLEDGKEEPDDVKIEGMHSETENDYVILVYHRQMADDYERLIAVKTINSVRTLQLTMPVNR